MSLESFVSDIIFGSGRGIGSIIPNVVIEEDHNDELVITDHPVDRSADVTDNSYIRPGSLRLRYGWSPSATAFHGLLSLLPITSGEINAFNQVFNGADDYLTDVYQQLRTLQRTRQPFQIITGKRIYESMLLQQISFSTNKETEYAMIVTLSCREVILVNVVTSVVAPPSAQSDPQQTAGTADAGTVQPAPIPADKNQSLLKASIDYAKGLLK